MATASMTDSLKTCLSRYSQTLAFISTQQAMTGFCQALNQQLFGLSLWQADQNRSQQQQQHEASSEIYWKNLAQLVFQQQQQQEEASLPFKLFFEPTDTAALLQQTLEKIQSYYGVVATIQSTQTAQAHQKEVHDPNRLVMWDQSLFETMMLCVLCVFEAFHKNSVSKQPWPIQFTLSQSKSSGLYIQVEAPWLQAADLDYRQALQTLPSFAQLNWLTLQQLLAWHEAHLSVKPDALYLQMQFCRE